MLTSSSGELRRHDERLAVLARQQLVGGVVVEEAFGLRVHLQGDARAWPGSLSRSTSLACRCSSHSAEGLGAVRVVRGGPHGFRRDRVRCAEAVGDVAGVAEGAREVAFEDVGVQVCEFPAADGLDEVGVVVSRAPSNFWISLPSLSKAMALV